MNPRPLYHLKSFWFGMLVVGFLGWAWFRSIDRPNSTPETSDPPLSLPSSAEPAYQNSADNVDSLMMLGLIEGRIISYQKISEDTIEVMTSEGEGRSHGFVYIIKLDAEKRAYVATSSTWDS